MINVSKPIKIPTVLIKKGKAANIENRKKYKANPKSKITIDKKIYGHKTVKDALKQIQHKKCCFCEKNEGDQYGAIEHYRPKDGYKDKKGQKIKKPGYYGQGYTWTNLYFVCAPCNTIKGALFPLEIESKRAVGYQRINRESPYLLDPGGVKNPRDHIVFDFELIRGLTDFGKQTIEICGLDREGLDNARKKLIDNINVRLYILDRRIHHSLRQVEEAEKFIINSIKAESEFSAAAIDYLKKKGVSLV
jgi:5-methylcytosine-specific restriction endonuclease McrA